MYRNTYNRKLTKAVKELTVYCDRGNWEKANTAREEVEAALDDLLSFTASRIALKQERERELATETKRPEEDPGDQEETPTPKRKPGRPSKKVSNTKSSPES